MSVYVSFQQPVWGGSFGAAFAGGARASESIDAGSSGALAAQDGEVVVLVNTGSDILYVAHGKTPDATAVVATAATSSRYAVPAGIPMAFALKTGDSVAVASS